MIMDSLWHILAENEREILFLCNNKKLKKKIQYALLYTLDWIYIQEEDISSSQKNNTCIHNIIIWYHNDDHSHSHSQQLLYLPLWCW